METDVKLAHHETMGRPVIRRKPGPARFFSTRTTRSLCVMS